MIRQAVLFMALTPKGLFAIWQVFWMLSVNFALSPRSSPPSASRTLAAWIFDVNPNQTGVPAFVVSASPANVGAMAGKSSGPLPRISDNDATTE